MRIRKKENKDIAASLDQENQILIKEISKIKTMATAKFDLDKFNGENDFNLWRIKMKALMVHQGISAAISMEEISATENKKLQMEIQSKAHSALILNLGVHRHEKVSCKPFISQEKTLHSSDGRIKGTHEALG